MGSHPRTARGALVLALAAGSATSVAANPPAFVTPLAGSGVRDDVREAWLELRAGTPAADFAASEGEPRPVAPASRRGADTAHPVALFAGETVVTATARPETHFELPYSVTVLSREVLDGERIARTLPEALEGTTGVAVQKTAHGQGSPFIRGFTGFRTVFLIDGIRLNNGVFRDGPNQYAATVDPFALGSLEVVRGPGSVLYGSDAVGGTVAAFTPALPAAGWDGALRYRFASAESSHGGRAEVGGALAGRGSFRLGVSAKRFGNLEAGGDVGVQPHTGYDEEDVDLTARLDLGEDRWLVLAHQQVAVDDAWRTHKTVHGVSWEGTTVGDELRRSLDQERALSYVQYHDRRARWGADEVTVSLSLHRQEEEQLRVRNDRRSDRQGFTADTGGLWLRASKQTRAGRLAYGAELYRDWVDSFALSFAPTGELRKEGVQGPVADDATYDLWGVYLQDRVALGPRLEVMVGGRYTGARLAADRVEDPLGGGTMALRDDWRQLVGDLRLLVRPVERWRLYAGVSQGFRAPNLSDLTRLDSARSNEIETPAPGLEPEGFVSYELGLKSDDLAGGAATLALFHTAIDGMIVRVPTGRLVDGLHEVTKRNAGDGHVQGVELEGIFPLGRALWLFGNASWLEGEVDTYPSLDTDPVREPMDRVMPPVGRLGLRWHPPGFRGWVDVVWTVAGRQDRLSSRDAADVQRIPPGGTPGYELLTVRGGWDLPWGLGLHVAVENLTNEDYRVHGSGINGPGRNVVVATDFRF